MMFLEDIAQKIYFKYQYYPVNKELEQQFNDDLLYECKMRIPCYHSNYPRFKMTINSNNNADLQINIERPFLEYVKEFYPHEYL